MIEFTIVNQHVNPTPLPAAPKEIPRPVTDKSPQVTHGSLQI